MTQPAEVDPLYAAATAGFLLGFFPALLIVGMRRELDPVTYSERITYLSVLGVLFLFALNGIVQQTDHGAQAMAELNAHWDDVVWRLRLLPALLPSLWAGVVLGRFFGVRSRTKQQRTGRMSLLDVLREQLGYRPLPPVPWAPRRGRLARWDDQRGFGFIQPDQHDLPELFVHVRAFRGRRRPKSGHNLRFVVGERDAKMQAVSASILGLSFVPSTVLLYMILAGLLVTLGANVHRYAFAGELLHSTLSLVVVAMSLITFNLYRVDVDRARRRGWRVSEFRLHLFELLGGWPGGLLAQWYFRHKNRKLQFQIVFWCIVAFHFALAWFVTQANTVRPTQ